MEFERPAKEPSWLGINKSIGQILLLAGLLVVIFARGCDSAGSRSIASANAKYQEVKNEFNDKWELKMSDSEDRSGKYYREMRESRDKERKELEKGEWRALRNASRNAEISKAKKGPWIEWLFILGTLGFTLGLLVSSFTSEGAERWVCLIMLAIITFSIYVIGSPWLSSIVPQLK